MTLHNYSYVTARSELVGYIAAADWNAGHDGHYFFDENNETVLFVTDIIQIKRESYASTAAAGKIDKHVLYNDNRQDLETTLEELG